MKWSKIFFLIMLCILLPALCALAYTPNDAATVTETWGVIGPSLSINSFRYVDLEWTAATGATLDTTIVNDAFSRSITGRIVQIVTDPDTTDFGTGITDSTLTGLKPADNYDVQILTESGEDILGGSGANRDESNTERCQPLIGSLLNPEAWVDDTLTLYITNINRSGANGRVRIIWQSR